MTTRRKPPAGKAAQPEPAAQQRTAIEELRHALAHMSGAERRLRSRDHQRHPGELTHAQLRSIAALGRESEMTVGQLAKSADLKPASVTVMLDHLEEANIVERQRSTEDRRVCNVSLTPQGWQLLERKLGAWQALWEQRLTDVSDEDLETAVRVIRLVTELYDSITPPPDDDA